MNKKRILAAGVVFLLFAGLFCYSRHSTDGLEMIRRGDFAPLTELETDQLAELKRIYERCQSMGGMEWIYADINDDGDSELIWQEKDPAMDGGIHRILAAFAATPDGCKRIVWDAEDMGEFYFLGNQGLIYFSSYEGTNACYFWYMCEYGDSWEERVNTIYEVYDIDDPSDAHFEGAEGMEGLNWEQGIYYVRGSLEERERYVRVFLDSEEWMEQFRDDILPKK